MPEENKAVGRIWDMSSSLQSQIKNVLCSSIHHSLQQHHSTPNMDAHKTFESFFGKKNTQWGIITLEKQNLNHLDKIV